MLKGMRRDAFVKSIISFVWWILILIVIPYVSWLYVKPYVDQIMHTYQQVQGTSNAVNAKLSGLPDLNKLYQQMTGGK